ncbi:MAG: cupin [Anaerolineae bacterium]|nr:cupin domain-containing protein [Anaerolineales bacterium]MCQ3974676.1 cupin [Anaerolineae bacterium]
MTLNYTYLANLAEQIPEIPPDSIVSRTIYSDDQVKAILFGFAAGQELSEHTSAQMAVLHFIQGEADLTLGDHSMSAQVGTWVHMPPRLPHSVYARTQVLMLLLMFKTSSSTEKQE